MGGPPPSGAPTDPALYLQLFGEFDHERYNSRIAKGAITQLGGPALIFRGFAHARRRAWLRARADFEAALAHPRGLAPLQRWVCGAGLVAAHAYDRGLATIAEAARLAPPAGRDRRGVRIRARKLALELGNALGWIHEARAQREQLARDELAARAPHQAGALERRRRAALDARLDEICAGELAAAAGRAWGLVPRLGPELAARALARLEREHPRASRSERGDLELTRAQLRLALLEGQLDVFETRFTALSPALQAQLASERAAWAHARGAVELESLAPGSGDPRLDYFRGLALTDAARPAEAAEVLEQVRALVPDSPTVVLALAIARHEQDPATLDEGIEHRFEALRARIPALLADAAELCGHPLWTEPGAELERPAKLELLRQAQAMITAERDLELTSYRGPSHGPNPDSRGPLRHVPPHPSDGAHLARLESLLEATLERHEAISIWGLGIEPPTRDEPRSPSQTREPAPPWTPRSLEPETIEAFIRDGFCVVREALSPAFAREIRAAAVERIRGAPQDWVRGYDANDPSRSLQAFDPANPETWTWDRIELVGPESWTIESLAPRAWAAICDLLGGPGRIASPVWGNYLILALRHPEALERVEPAPSSPGWHIDDPPPTARIDNFRNGLVCIVLFDDLAPRSGNTWLAPESVGLVARELAAHPEGLDLIARRGAPITSQCERFVEVTGKVGDVLLLHPLLMHSASNNPSDRIRWMANPMVYLHEPLDPRRPAPERSPVEEAIARALRG